uniref:Reverse transcriptase/retrotransposon-derived protein RNase H-like domain-containing protein n=1 Tax=Kryptolebias marmoratus TaxID=37003 RepID=A0A3Q3A1J1_KRYMA
MMTFLGFAGYSSAWVEDYVKLTGPLRTMIKETGSNHLHRNLTWTPDGCLAFETLKQKLQEAPALALPDYSKNFVLYVSTSIGGKYACAVLCQSTGTGLSPQPVAYYSTAFSEVELDGVRGNAGMFMGISECDNYWMPLNNKQSAGNRTSQRVTFQDPASQEIRTLLVENQPFPANVTIGNFKDLWWICGGRAYIFLPYGWTGCCYMAFLKLPYDVFTMQRGVPPDNVQPTSIPGNRQKRALAQFHNLESYHWRISLGEKWAIGLFPHYGVTFLAAHIDNITYTLQGFANETIKGFQYLTDTQRSHRLTLLKHDMALDYILAKQGGLCVALTGEACYTLVPDSSDNITSVIDGLKIIRDAFGPSEGAGWSANAWLQEKFGSFGAMLVQGLIVVVLALCVTICFCTLLLTCVKAMILRWNKLNFLW